MPAKIKPHLCKHCGETDPANFYVLNKSGKTNKSTCKDCHNANSKAKKDEIKIKMINYLGGKCKLCGYSLEHGSAYALELHHINPKQKDANFKTFRGWKWERAKEEAKKCVLLCSNCHREEHDLSFLKKHNRPQNRWLF
jgi:hypothetical protein